ncbi:MAG: hypothetical protein U0636_01345 [Phycisphaerales bacterium]
MHHHTLIRGSGLSLRVALSVRIAALAALTLPCALALADEDIPAYQPKPQQWKTGLVTHESVVWDTEFAAWMAAGEKKAHDTVAGTWKLQVRCTFAHCYSGGFIQELDLATTATPPLTDFAANSACRYFETASAYEDAGVPATGWYSRYAFAWTDRGVAGAGQRPVWTMQEITKRAYNGMLAGGVGDITANPGIAYEHPQYRSNVDPDDLKTGDLKLAILFAGDPEQRHINNMDKMRAMLKDKYGFAAANIWVMCGNYGPGDAIPTVTWGSDAKATRAELEKALRDAAGFVVSRVKTYANDQELNDKKVKLFIFTTDHGTADAPILFGVTSDTTGEIGTDVFAEAKPAEHLYNGGNLTNTLVWIVPGPAELDSFSTGNDELYQNQPPVGTPSGTPGLYFSVDRDSQGLATTDVARVLGQARDPAACVFTVAVPDDNREFVAGTTVGLLEHFLDEDFNPLPTDNLCALSTVPANLVFTNTGIPLQPVFYTLYSAAAPSPKIWVQDPWHPLNPGKVYVYWDPARDGWPVADALPQRLDGLSMLVNMAPNKRMPQNPMAQGYDPVRAGDLKFKLGQDAMVFSVPTGDPFRASGCDIYRWNGQNMETIYTCQELGLRNDDDVDALQTYVNSPYRTAMTPINPSCPPDYDQNGMVDGSDLGILLGNWEEPGAYADLNGDGVTNGEDLGILLGYWGPCP